LHSDTITFTAFLPARCHTTKQPPHEQTPLHTVLLRFTRATARIRADCPRYHRKPRWTPLQRTPARCSSCMYFTCYAPPPLPAPPCTTTARVAAVTAHASTYLAHTHLFSALLHTRGMCPLPMLPLHTPTGLPHLFHTPYRLPRCLALCDMWPYATHCTLDTCYHTAHMNTWDWTFQPLLPLPPLPSHWLHINKLQFEQGVGPVVAFLLVLPEHRAF